MIVPSEPNVSLNGRYTVSETCRILGIHRNTLRKYTQSGAIRCGVRRVDSRKYYLGSEIKRLWNSKW